MEKSITNGELTQAGNKKAINVEKTLKELQSYFNKFPDERRPNIWSIIEYGKNSYETRYSRFLRWLLDPSGNHGAGDAFIRELWKALKTKQKKQMAGKEAELESTETEWSTETDADCEVYYKDDSLVIENGKPKRRFIDILVYDKVHKRYLCIELKVLSKAHTNQLTSYAEYLKNEETYKDTCGLLAFISPDGADPDNDEWDESWVGFSYGELREVLLNLYNHVKGSEIEYKNDTCKYIYSFRSDLKKYYYVPKFNSIAKKLCSELDEEQIRVEVEKFYNPSDKDKEQLVKHIEENRFLKAPKDETGINKLLDLSKRLANKEGMKDVEIKSNGSTKFTTDNLEDIFGGIDLAYYIITSYSKGVGIAVEFNDPGTDEKREKCILNIETYFKENKKFDEGGKAKKTIGITITPTHLKNLTRNNVDDESYDNLIEAALDYDKKAFGKD
ncbi:MAG: PD-(D/E)XK nuclease family protein [Oscillospiraceae bacterium]|nr:PD-(D/E)XK nuclease family protein [Oscillospiraceae bacterium]